MRFYYCEQFAVWQRYHWCRVAQCTRRVAQLNVILWTRLKPPAVCINLYWVVTSLTSIANPFLLLHLCCSNTFSTNSGLRLWFAKERNFRYHSHFVKEANSATMLLQTRIKFIWWVINYEICSCEAFYCTASLSVALPLPRYIWPDCRTVHCSSIMWTQNLSNSDINWNYNCRTASDPSALFMAHFCLLKESFHNEIYWQNDFCKDFRCFFFCNSCFSPKGCLNLPGYAPVGTSRVTIYTRATFESKTVACQHIMLNGPPALPSPSFFY